MPSLECGFGNRVHLELYGPSARVRIGFDPEYKPGKYPTCQPKTFLPS